MTILLYVMASLGALWLLCCAVFLVCILIWRADEADRGWD